MRTAENIYREFFGLHEEFTNQDLDFIACMEKYAEYFKIKHNEVYVSDAQIANYKGVQCLAHIDKSLWQAGALWMRKELIERQNAYIGV